MGMINRYAKETMAALWAELRKKRGWHTVEVAVLGAREKLEEIPAGVRDMVAALMITPEILAQADEIEAKTDHDLIAFVLAVTEQLVSEAKPWYHDGLTSFDDEDTALAILMGEALDIIEDSLKRLAGILRRRANEHRKTVMVARTHNIHAKPYSFGLKLLNWLDLIEFHIAQIQDAKFVVKQGKLSGAVGTYTLDPQVEDLACADLGLQPARISTQVISRHVHLHYAKTLVAIANSLDKMAIDIRLLAGTDVGEVTEYKRPGAKGSSAMPGKSFLRNPIKSENVCSLAKLARGYLIPALECQQLWHERTLDNSAAERIWLPDLTIVVHFMLERFSEVIDKLEVFPEVMLANLWKTGGIIFAENVMMALTATGMPRPEAYDKCESLCLKIRRGAFTTEDGLTFRDLVFADEGITSRVEHSVLEQCFDAARSLQHVDTVYARFEL
jgi:adenylosuccinate lyase